jgi:magnesium-transporting ATPase (P-type)
MYSSSVLYQSSDETTALCNNSEHETYTKSFNMSFVPLIQDESNSASVFVFVTSILVILLSFAELGLILLYRTMFPDIPPEQIVPHNRIDNALITIIATLGLIGGFIGFMSAKTSYPSHVLPFTKAYMGVLSIILVAVTTLTSYLGYYHYNRPSPQLSIVIAFITVATMYVVYLLAIMSAALRWRSSYRKKIIVIQCS